ncbi:hypothetical protein PVAND_007201 [Polypedilum vanderplanki]|uniref:Uncharacterized protein n=1 Tax=Polypedilum vanderplanki TaxID=319348 RepID=A0A9J6C6J2_POLVA|nr:hypothetical protein PVAND_007201 [Polypedilum vanderplanki]
MTVEATSFLSTSKISNSHEKSAKILKNHKNLIIILLAFVLLLFSVLASILQIYIYNELNKSQEEIEQLKKDIQEIKNNELDRKLITEINAFNRKYHNQNDVQDQINLDEKVDLIENDKVKFDDVGDENDEEEEELDEQFDENEDDNYEGYPSGYGDDEYDDEYDLDSLEDSEDIHKTEKDDNNNIYEDMKKLTRKTRSITGITEQGIPILEEPYALRRNRTKLNELNREKNPRLKLTWNGNHRNIHGQHKKDFNHERHRHHHYNINNMRHQHQNTDISNRFAFAAAPVHHIKSFGQVSYVEFSQIICNFEVLILLYLLM